MGRIYTLEEAAALPAGQLRAWAYNALDSTGTREIADTLLPRLTPDTLATYQYERALQAPAVAMMQRGVLVDTVRRDQMVRELKRELMKDITSIAGMPGIQQVWDKTEKNTGWCPAELGKHHKWEKWEKGKSEVGRHCTRCGADRLEPMAFNPMSSDDVRHLFYDLLAIPPMLNKKHEVSADEDVLERLAKKYPQHKGIVSAILAVRDKRKQLGTLNARLTAGSRYPSTFNVGAAWTGRFSASKNPFGEGGNLQNLSERHRVVFIPDPGMDMGYADLKTAESLTVAHLAGDEEYIKAHKQDTHTFVARLVWPELGWVGDIREDKKRAKSLIPEWDNIPGHDYRFQSKSIQHGSNLGLTPYGIAMQKHIPQKQAFEAQAAYFRAFPFIRGWQNWIREKVHGHERIENPLGRSVQLFGRPWDDHTVNQGLAFQPQSTVADILDLALWRVWYYMDPEEVQVLAQVHDAILFQYPKGRLDLVRKMAALMRIPVDIRDYRGELRRMTIGVEVAVGSNWGHKSKTNPYGLEEVEV